jgi:hypothetical protein
VCIQNSGSIYYANTANLSQFFAANGSNIVNKTWGGIAWSGDGSSVVAVIASGPVSIPIQISRDSGNTWNDLYGYGVYGKSISTNSNATRIYTGNGNALFETRFIDNSWSYNGICGPCNSKLPFSTGEYRTATSFLGDIIVAVDTLCGSVWSSYDNAATWVRETRFKQNAPTVGFTGAALSSDGLVEIIVGLSSTLQSIISVPVSTGTSTICSSAPGTLINTSVTVNADYPGTTGYNVTPSRKSLPGPIMYVWRTPTPGPKIYPQSGTGEAVIGINGKSGWYISNGVQIGIIVVNQYNTPYFGFANPGYPTTNYSPPTITKQTYGSDTELTAYFIKPDGTGDLPPGTYQFTAGESATSPVQSDISIFIPLRPPQITSVTSSTSKTQINVSWSILPVYNDNSPTIKIYSNSSVIATVNGNSTSQLITNPGVSFTLGVARQNGVVTSTLVTRAITCPEKPTLVLSGYDQTKGGDAFSNVKITWSGAVGATSYVLTGGTTQVTSPYSFIINPGSQGTANIAAVNSDGFASGFASITVSNTLVNSGQKVNGATYTSTPAGYFLIKELSLIGGGGYGQNGGGSSITGEGNGGLGGQGGNSIYLSNGYSQYSNLAIRLTSAQQGSIGYYSSLEVGTFWPALARSGANYGGTSGAPELFLRGDGVKYAGSVPGSIGRSGSTGGTAYNSNGSPLGGGGPGGPQGGAYQTGSDGYPADTTIFGGGGGGGGAGGGNANINGTSGGKGAAGSWGSASLSFVYLTIL